MNRLFRESALLLIVASAPGCTPLIVGNFVARTGIPIDDADIPICIGATVRNALNNDCTPTVGGAKWVETTNIAPYHPSSLSPEAPATEPAARRRSIAAAIFASYVGHVYADADVQPDCPGLNPFDAEHHAYLADKTQLEFSAYSIESVFAKQAVESAAVTLDAEASAQGVNIGAEAMASFRLKLEETIKSTTESSTDVVYIQAYWRGGLTNMATYDGYKECFAKVRPGRDSIITGVAGLYFSNFKSRKDFFSGQQLTLAVEATLKGQWTADPAKLEAIKAKAATKWQKDMTETLTVKMAGSEFSDTFQPSYIRFERPPQ